MMCSNTAPASLLQTEQWAFSKMGKGERADSKGKEEGTQIGEQALLWTWRPCWETSKQILPERSCY